MTPADRIGRLATAAKATVAAARGDLVIGVVDGPVDASDPHLHRVLVEGSEREAWSCIVSSSPACRHGTFVASRIARRCPDARLVVHPLFCEEARLDRCPRVRPRHLADALERLMDRGARVINMSVGLQGGPPGSMSALHRAYRRAERDGVLLVAAAGNDAASDANPLVRDPWVIPVAAHDDRGTLLPSSNRGGRIARHGLRAAGVGVLESPTAAIVGTSVAAPLVTAAAARLWALHPEASAAEIRRALLRPDARRHGPVPPPLDLDASRRCLARAVRRSPSSPPEPTRSSMMQTLPSATAPSSREDRSMGESPGVVVPQACACSPGAIAGFVYSTGMLEPRFPSEGDRRELQSRARELQVPSDDYYSVLSKFRYLARRVCWVLSVAERPVGILVPRSEAELTDLIEALSPELRPNPELVVTGTQGSTAPPGMCAGLEVPMVSVAELDYFTKEALLDRLRKELGGQGANAADVDQVVQRVWTATGLWRQPGFDDEQRAKNYLTLRTTGLYETTLTLGQAGAGRYWLQAITAREQETEDGRSVVQVDAEYQNASGRTQTYRAEVDVTDLFAFQSKALYTV